MSALSIVKDTDISSRRFFVLNITFTIFVLGFPDSQSKAVSELDSSNTPSLPEEQSSVVFKESTNQKQTENLTNSTAGMAVIGFISWFLRTEHYSFSEYGQWYCGLKVWLVGIEKFRGRRSWSYGRGKASQHNHCGCFARWVDTLGLGDEWV